MLRRMNYNNGSDIHTDCSKTSPRVLLLASKEGQCMPSDAVFRK